jgi:hypothetical protein
MTELTKAETSRVGRSLNERIAAAAIVTLLIAVQMVYVAKHSVSLAAIVAPATFGIIAP